METRLHVDALPTAAARSGGAEVEIESLHHRYGGRAVLGGVDLSLQAGGHLAVMGRSGAGKSTLLSLIGGLDSVQEGSIKVGGAPLERLRGGALAEYRRRMVGFVFQHFGLLESLTALENVELALAIVGGARPARWRRAQDLLEQVGLGGQRDQLPATLSGGERQRTAIARALANQPQVVLADEPTGNLDEETAAQVLDLLDRERRARGCTLIVVTHDPTIAARADRCLRLHRGSLRVAG